MRACDRALRTPRVQERNASRFEVSHIALHNGHAVHQGRSGDEGIAVGTAVRNMEPCTSPRDGAVDNQHPAGKCRKNMPAKADPKHRALCRVAALDQFMATSVRLDPATEQ